MQSQAYVWERKRWGAHKKRIGSRSREESKAVASQVLVAAGAGRLSHGTLE